MKLRPPFSLQFVPAFALAIAAALLCSAYVVSTPIGALPGDDGTGWDLVEPAPAIPLEPAVLEDLEALECTECHRETVAEWASSAHGLAWVDVEYRESLEDRRRPEKCYDCHIPEPLMASGTPAAKIRPREEDRVHGISCDSCHLGPDGAYLGPWGGATAAHASVASEHFQGSGTDAVCIACHAKNVGPVIGIAKDYEKSYAGGEGALTCVGCHMAPVERRFGQPAEGEEPPPVRAGRSHALQTPRDPAFLRQAFALSAERSGSGATVIVRNRAGHRVPGLVGRELEFTAEVLDADGKVLAQAGIVVDKQRYVPVGGETRIELERAGSEVRVRATHDAPTARKPLEFLDVRLPLAP